MSRVAFYTFAILREHKGHEQVQGFFDSAGSVFDAANKIDGFIETVVAKVGSPDPFPQFFDKSKHAVPAETLSLWKDLESVFAFAYYGFHGGIMKKGREWLVKSEWPFYLAWWVEDDHTPTSEEAHERQKYLHDHGPSPYAFNFKKPFDENDQPTRLDQKIVKELVKSR